MSGSPQTASKLREKYGVQSFAAVEREIGDASSGSSRDGQLKGDGTTSLQRARRPGTQASVAEGLMDLIVAMSSLYFVIFSALVYTSRGESKDSEWGRALLRMAQYGPTIFPVMFSAIVARFLLVLAHAKLESGARVLTLEHLLHSRTVFSTFTASVNLKSFHMITPALIILWALSPLGGQASLRIVSTEPQTTSVLNNFTYLAYTSSFSNQGVGSTSAGTVVPINAGFTSALVSSTDSKASHQDPYGNIKVPILERLRPRVDSNASAWREIPDTGEVVWSSLIGLPVLGLPVTANSTLTLNTGYMMAQCQTNGESTDLLFQDMNNFTYTAGGGWSGSNFAITAQFLTFYGAPAARFVFRALASQAPLDTAQTLSVANCTVYMQYVEQEVRCQGRVCRSLRMRPALSPAAHVLPQYADAKIKANLTEYSPLSGLAQRDSMVTKFFNNFVNATNPSAGCATSNCPFSGLEGYLVDPKNPFNVLGTPLIWQQGDELISQRMTQLLGTYWLSSIAPYSLTGNFSLPAADPSSNTAFGYNTDSFMGTIDTTEIVIRCNIEWMVILLLASAVMFLCGVYSTVMGLRRRGPEILDSFTSLLRDNKHVHDPGFSSMDDAADQARRLRNTIVRLGDVRPDREIGHVAIAASGTDGILVGALSPKKLYD